MEHRPIRLQGSGFALQVRMVEHDLARIVGNNAVFGVDDGSIRAIEHHMNL